MNPDADPIAVKLPLAYRRWGFIVGMVVIYSGVEVPFRGHSGVDWLAIMTAVFNAVVLICLDWYLVFWGIAKCVVSITPEIFSIRATVLGIGLTKAYPLREISNLRFGYERSLTDKPMLVFDHNTKTIFFREWFPMFLSVADQDQLFNPIYIRFPGLRPR